MLLKDLLHKTVISLFRSKNKNLIRGGEFIIRDLGFRINEVGALISLIENQVKGSIFDGEEVDTILMRLRIIGTAYIDSINFLN